MRSSVTTTYGAASYSPGQFVGTTPSLRGGAQVAGAGGHVRHRRRTSRTTRAWSCSDRPSSSNLFGNANPLGQTIKVNGIGFTVVGVLASKGTNGIQDQDDIAIAPLSTTQELLTGVTGGLSQIVIEATDERAP